MDTDPKSTNARPVKAGQEGVAFLVNQTSRAFRRELSKTISNYGLNPDDYTVVRHVVRESAIWPDGVPIAELSRKLNISEQLIWDSAVKLERDDWLSIVAVPGATRALSPSRKAHQVTPVLIDASQWMLEQALNGFSHAEIDLLTNLLQRVLKNLDVPIGEDEGPLGG